MDDAYKDITPDAVLIPTAAAASIGQSKGQLALALKAEYGPIFNSPRVWFRMMPLGELYVTPHLGVQGVHDNPKGFPGNHASAGQDRHIWVDRGDGIMYGFLRPDAALTKPAAPPTAEQAAARRGQLAKLLEEKMGRLAELEAKDEGSLAADERNELMHLSALRNAVPRPKTTEPTVAK